MGAVRGHWEGNGVAPGGLLGLLGSTGRVTGRHWEVTGRLLGYMGRYWGALGEPPIPTPRLYPKKDHL